MPFESRLNNQETTITTDISAIGALKSAIESVQESIEDLADADNYQQRNASGNDAFISLTSTSDAEVGSYSVKVDALASEHKLSSAAFLETDPVGEGTLTLSSGVNSFDIVTTDTSTLEDIRDAINDSEDNESITATIVTGVGGQHLVLSSTETGVDNAITITVDDIGDGDNIDNTGLSRLAYQPDSLAANFATNMTETIAASDAQITIDGNIVATSANNTFANVIDGIDITAKKSHDVDDDISNIGITENNSNISTGIENFVESYNSFLELGKSLGQSGEDGGGALSGDSLLRGIMSKLRQKLSEPFEVSNGNTLSLIDMGVSTDRFGVLSVDSEELDTFIESNVDDIQQFFVGTDSVAGFATSIDELANFYTDSDGIIDSRIESREAQLERIDDDRISFARKMEALESRLLAQYNAMDLLVAQLGATSDYVTAQLDNMPGVVRQNN